MLDFPEFKFSSEGDTFRIGLCPSSSSMGAENGDDEQTCANPRLQELMRELEEVEKKEAWLREEIDRRTNCADSKDIIFACVSGVVCGLVDAVQSKSIKTIVGRSDERLVADASLRIASYFIQHGGQSGVPNDKPNDGKTVKRTMFDKIEERSHSPNLKGLFCSVATQFASVSNIESGGGNVENRRTYLKGKALVTKLMYGVLNWFGDLVSTLADMPIKEREKISGGILFPFYTVAKDFARAPGMNKNFLPSLVAAAIASGQIVTPDSFDMVDTVAVLRHQIFPVLLNEAIVRSAYMIRRLLHEVKRRDRHGGIRWNRVVPVRNRTVERMMVVASGTLVAVDAAQAELKGFANHGEWFSGYLYFNYLGQMRFVLALGRDVQQGFSKCRLEKELLVKRFEMLKLKNIQVSYGISDIWHEIVDVEQTISDMLNTVNQTTSEMEKVSVARNQTFDRICERFSGVKRNPERFTVPTRRKLRVL